MKSTIDMAREAKMPYDFVTGEPMYLEKLKVFEALVRADECALAAPVQETDHIRGVTKMIAEPFGYFKAEPFGWTDCDETDEGAIALYEHPAVHPAPVQEPVACPECNGKGEIETGIGMMGCTYCPPAAQRQWVGLTLEDKEEFLALDIGGSRLDAMDWAARKLKEKNHG